jgi:hypothetical protein
MSDLDRGQTSADGSACRYLAASDASTGGCSDTGADWVRIQMTPLARQQSLTVPARIKGRRIASVRARLADEVQRLDVFALITHREGRDA